MPIKPKPDESEDEFVSRCMSEESEAIPDDDQRSAACHRMWDDEMNAEANADADEMTAKVADLFGRQERHAGGYQFKAAGREVEILIYEEIGDDMFGGVSAKQIATDLRSVRVADKIRLRINSPGGNIFDGVAIYNTLINHAASVEVFVDGLAASAASVVAMAGDPIHMADNAVMMIHDPWFMAIGNAAEMRAIADSLDKVADGMALTYARRSGKPVEDARAWMQAETWFTAEEARAAGLADTIAESVKMAAHFDVAAWRKRFRHPPEAIFSQIEEDTRPQGTPLSEYRDRFRHAAMLREKIGRKVG